MREPNPFIHVDKKKERPVSGVGTAPKSFIRNEKLMGKYDPKSVALKFQQLSPEIRTALDHALNGIGLSYEQCFTDSSFLETLTLEQLKTLSGLRGSLILEQNSRTPHTETFKEIANLLK